MQHLGIEGDAEMLFQLNGTEDNRVSDGGKQQGQEYEQDFHGYSPGYDYTCACKHTWRPSNTISA
ncbi:MAG: hypothetical protein BWY76_02258 [bacterium ADurb.Bin429]|nr:MAG: hypothetical protein BWY76_02258 [bacterium ADurb.Bin429]